MSKIRKILTLAACAVLLVCITVAGTVAYLTSKTEAVNNTFTVGNVTITLDEAKVNTDGKPVNAEGKEVADVADAPRVKENAYKLYPGHEYIKDPTIHVGETSDDCYVVAKVVLSGVSKENLTKLLGYTEGTDTYIGFGAIVSGGIFKETITYDATNKCWKNDNVKLTQTINEDDTVELYVYFLKPQSANADLVIFDTLKMPTDWTNADIALIDDLNIGITAYAMQKDGFANVETAFSTCFAE